MMGEEEKKRGSPFSWGAVVCGVLAFGPVGVPMGMGLLRLAVRALRGDLSLVIPIGCLVAPLLLMAAVGVALRRRAGFWGVMIVLLSVWLMLPLGGVLEFFAPLGTIGVGGAILAALFYLGPPLGLVSVAFSALAHLRKEARRGMSVLPGVYGACLVVVFGALWVLVSLGVIKL
jgi:hypothetical protein